MTAAAPLSALDATRCWYAAAPESPFQQQGSPYSPPPATAHPLARAPPPRARPTARTLLWVLVCYFLSSVLFAFFILSEVTAATDNGYLVVSINVTLLISLSVVNPRFTLSSADSRRKCIPSSRAALRISLLGRFARIISRTLSVSSSSS